MKSIDLTPLYRNSIGFDRMAGMFDSAMKANSPATNYPDYNIEVIEENRYAITLDVAGFSESDIEIKVENGILSVKGAGRTNTQKTYLYQGISDRAFECKFNLADHVEVNGASLTNGLLTIDLNREIPEGLKPRTIPIKTDDNAADIKSANPTAKKKNAA